MKFSVLLPTRNRLEYLTYAIETVRRQNYDDWEVIVSDNCSEDDIAGHVHALADPRIKYFRTKRLVPVTENWNNALQQSGGDYVVMLGDDDGLLPGYFSTLLGAFETYRDPDYIYVSAYFFAYQGVIADEPDGFLRRDRNRIFAREQPFWLDARRAEEIARGYLNFRMPVASNMQFSLISRRMIEELSRDGPFFRSPFPDFYATPLLFLRSKRILVCSRPLVVIGITPKSYGAFHFTNRPADGAKFLENDQQLTEAAGVHSLILPGTSYNDSWLLAMEALRTTLDGDRGLSPNYRRYRFLQIVHSYKSCYYDRTLATTNLVPLQLKMSSLEKAMFGFALPAAFSMLRRIPTGLRARIITMLRRLLGQHSIRKETSATSSYRNILDVYESLETKHAPR